MKKAIIIFLFLLSWITLPTFANSPSTAKYSPVMTYLTYIVKHDPTLQKAIMVNMHQAGEKHTFWRNKTLPDFYTFFNSWLKSQLKPIHGDNIIIHGHILRYD